MEPEKKILFVCTGNVCRSVLAEKLLNKLAAERGLAWEARSCGVAAQRYSAASPEIRRILEREGAPPFTHVPQLVGRDLLRWADLTLTMTQEHRRAVLERFPEFHAKVRVLLPHVGLPGADVEDPMGRGDEAYERSARDIKEALERLFSMTSDRF